MNLLNLLEDVKDDSSPFGDLVQDIEDDPNFPISGTEDEMLRYIKSRLSWDNLDVYNELILALGLEKDE